MERRLPDVSKLSSAIGFAPRTSLDEILRGIVDFERTKAAIP
jgi:hypothetical protein